MRLNKFFPLAALGALAIAMTPLGAQQASPEQRIGRLEKQLRQVQRVVFPKGQPADTAGFSDAPAATQDSVAGLAARVDALERQMAELVRASEENGNRLSVIEADIARLRAETDGKFRALQAPAPEAPAGDTPIGDPAEAAGEAVEAAADRADAVVPDQPIISRPKVETPKPKPVAVASADPGEAAYDAGFKLWQAGKYDQAVTALNKMAKDYPTHRRVSWAYNLAGRAQLDKGDYRDAADTLLKNYRRDGQGERAQDSVFYLGEALTKLGQPSQACKAYEELEGVYAGSVRPQLRALLPAAKKAAKCS